MGITISLAYRLLVSKQKLYTSRIWLLVAAVYDFSISLEGTHPPQSATTKRHVLRSAKTVNELQTLTVFAREQNE